MSNEGLSTEELVQALASLRKDNEALRLDGEQKTRLIEQLTAQVRRQARLLNGIYQTLGAFMVEEA